MGTPSPQGPELPSKLRQAERHALSHHEEVIARGLSTFLEVGVSLLAIRTERLYRETHRTFEAYCQERWGMSRRHANRLIASSEVVKNLGPMGPNPTTERQLRPLTNLPPATQRRAWQAAVEIAMDGKVTGADVETAVNGYVHFSSESDTWCTPGVIVERVVSVLRRIDLDPCSGPENHRTVPATSHYTTKDDGLSKHWSGRVYMNPPYGRPIAAWIEKLASEYEGGRVEEAITLVPARTDTEWFSRLRDHPRCFVRGRLSFGGHENSAPFPSMAVYLGRNNETFIRHFSPLGDIYECVS